MIKKFLFLLFVIVWLFFQWSFADSDLVNYVKKNFEYINIWISDLVRWIEYKSNQSNSYYFLWWYSYWEIKNLDSLKYSVWKTISKNWIFLVDWDNVIYIDKNSTNNYNKTNWCYSLNLDSYKILDAYKKINLENNYIIKISDYKPKLIGSVSDTSNCYIYNNDIYVVNEKYSSTDLSSLIPWYKSLLKITNKLVWANKSDTIKNIYETLLYNTDYDFESLKNYQSPPEDWYPFRVAPFFEWKKLVCDGYSKTMTFIWNLYWINLERVVWKLQPIEKSSLNFEWLWHSWVKYWDLYYDPTFDDNEPGKIKNNYFWRSKTCFNLNHYTTWWILFSNSDDRYKFIKQNYLHLIDNCSELLKPYLYEDWKFIDFIQYSLNNYSFEYNKKTLCVLFDVCDDKFNSKEAILDYYKTRVYILWEKEFDMWVILKWFKIQDVTQIFSYTVPNTKISSKVSDEYKKKVSLTIDLFFQKLKKVSKEKQTSVVSNLKNTISNLSKKSSITDNQKYLIEYISNKFIVEKLN